MMKERVLITDFSGVYGAEGFLEWLTAEGIPFERLDFAGIEGTGCYCDDTASAQITACLPDSLPRVRWIDSGDYHYMSHLLALREPSPFHLVLLDHHPDDQEPAFGGILSCGSWVEVMRRENPMLRDVLAIGPEGCPAGIPDNWLEERRGSRVYLSLDKDILSPDFARTDWTQGALTLADLEAMIARLAGGGVELVAVDICGELTEVKGAHAEDYAVNLRTNKELMRFIIEHLH